MLGRILQRPWKELFSGWDGSMTIMFEFSQHGRREGFRETLARRMRK